MDDNLCLIIQECDLDIYSLTELIDTKAKYFIWNFDEHLGYAYFESDQHMQEFMENWSDRYDNVLFLDACYNKI